MQFVKLRLSGFKSFVEPTEFAIEPGLTGIVGPNGCGKSNLVEALRWVMGENRVKALRGGEMDDVIFAGTTSRPARNVAEVSLLVENKENNAPAAYNDMADFDVVRRIEREKGSAYRIGGRDVRARDVQLFFQDIGSGAHSPSLVSQGRIGAIIQAKPTERRQILEEAAGITGLHSRRHEAELKLKAAEQNLARLDDVLTTLGAQLDGLKKQARQAARYRNMSDLVRRAEAILFHLRWEKQKADMEAAQGRLAAAEALVVDITTRAAAASTVLAEAQAILPDLRRDEAEAAAALTRLQVAGEQLADEERRVIGQIEALDARLAQLAADKAREETMLADTEAARARLAAEIEELAAHDARATEEEAGLAADIEERRAQVDTLDAELARATEAVAKAESERAALQREIGDLAGRLQRLADRRASVEADKAALEAHLAGSDEKRIAAEAKLADADAALNAALSAAEEAEGARRAAQEEEFAAREALRDADQTHSTLEGERQGISRAVAALTKNAGPHAPVMDALRVTPGYETALGAALGEDLSASLDGEAARSWKQLDIAGNPPALPLGAVPLSDFVQAPEALARRLTQIGVVESLAAAEALAPQLAQGQRLVTREGALWRWDGFAQRAGAASQAAELLTMRNRLETLDAELVRAREIAEGARTRFGASQGANRAAEAHDNAARQATRAANTAVEAARGEIVRIARETEAENAKLALIADEIGRLEADRAEHDERRAAAEARFAGIEDPAQARAKLAEDRQALSQARQALAEREAASARLGRERDGRERRRHAIAGETQGWEQRADSARRQIASLEERRELAESEREELAGRPAAIAAEREALLTKTQEVDAIRRAAADRLAEAENAVREADRALKAVEASLVEAREDRVREQGHVEQQTATGEQLVQTIRERLDCAPEDALAAGMVDPADELPAMEDIERRLERLVKERDNMGPVNLRAEQEAEEVEAQMTGMTTEKEDLVAAIAKLRQGISSLNKEARERLREAFAKVDAHFQDLFARLFGGGRAHLTLSPVMGQDGQVNDDPLEAGLDVMASPPGKKLQSLTLLSGGEQAMTALALLFAVFLTNPAPICVMDEVDAPLDDANVDRFCKLLDEIGRSSGVRFIVVTHHRLTMAKMDRLFGVTMAERGVSTLVSVDLRSAEKLRATA
ncbi:MAG: chromosome segregation protein SMC [Rhodospirillales bacterium]|nr:chromosome segregation protein SMC [Rhodospirillales bacterium]